MKQQIVTKGIVLSRVDYGEADRILTILTPEHGKLSMMARGVRKSKSKLAGGIELFSVSDITYMAGRGELGTLISSRLVKYYDNIVSDIERVQLGYELIKLLNKVTEDKPESDYFDLLEQSFIALNNNSFSIDLIRIWFHARLLRMAGHTPNLRTDTNDNKLAVDSKYNFDPEAMTFTAHEQGRYNATQIKTLRLLFDGHTLVSLNRVTGLEDSLNDISPLVKSMLTTHIRT
jgi:DNA repair protein RecO (recombination protein O)